jgi:putative hydrolase of the HAD superfamily
MEKIIFDLDNTLISNVNFSKYVAEAFDLINMPYTEENLKSIQKAIHDYELESLRYERNLLLDYFRRYTNLDLDMNFLDSFMYRLEYALPKKQDEGVRETLDYLAGKYQLCVLTNWFRYSQYMRLVNAGIDKYFTEVYGGEEYKKPHKEAYLMACGDSKASDTLMVGDSLEYDYQGAKNAGLNALLLDKDNKYSINPTEKINDIKELKKVL